MAAELAFWHDREVTWALYSEAGRPVELRVACTDEEPALGSVIKGRVARGLPGFQAAFVDIGGSRNGFLQGVGAVAVGAELLVQVERESLSAKGPRLSSAPSIAGWRLVYLTGDTRRAVSRRIRDDAERDRLRPLVEGLPGDGGFIARTAAVGADERTLRDEAESLRETWAAALRRAATEKAPAMVLEGPDLIVRSVQSAPADLERITVDRAESRDRLAAFFAVHRPAMLDRIEIRETAGDRLETLQGIVAKALRRKVWLPSGGSIVFEPTEALTSVDVNTGKFLGKGGAAKTALQTNLEAAAEIPRQLRLRDIGGLVVVDFIQLDDADARHEVLELLRQGVADDPSRTRVTGFSELGLVELARTRSRQSPAERVTAPCAHCAGSGRVRR